MSRRRYAFQKGTLTASVISSDTTIDSAELAALPAVAAPDYVAVTIGTEVLHVTAHTAASTSATVARGREGSTAAAHGSGAAWRCAPTPLDVLNHQADLVPANPSATDYEFDETSTSLPSGWSWVNQGSASYAEAMGVGAISTTETGSGVQRVRGIVRAVPAGSSWDIAARLTVAALSVNYVNTGLLMRESSSGKLQLFGRSNQNDSGGFITTFSSPTAYNGTVVNTPAIMRCQYLRIRKNSGTSYDYLMSEDGVVWVPLLSAHNPTTYLTPDQIGFAVDVESANTALVGCHWFRAS